MLSLHHTQDGFQEDSKLSNDQGRDGFICVRGLNKEMHSGDTQEHILRSLDFDARSGEVITILGVSGTGKSTFLNILGGIDRPTTGSVTVAGKDISTLTDSQLTEFRRESVGFVFQFYNLIPSLTVKENVLSAIEAQRRINKGDEDNAVNILNSVGLQNMTNKFPEQLSGGEQQRVAIARALIKRPPLILADEPTGNLDPHTGEQVISVLLENARSSKASLFHAPTWTL